MRLRLGLIVARFRMQLIVALVLLGAGLWGGLVVTATPPETQDRYAPLTARGYAVTEGAAPGYVDDRVCGACHRDLWTAYQEVGMSKSFDRPSAARAIEDFDLPPLFHAPSGRYYQMERDGDAYRFRRWQRDDAGARINEVALPVDWILGSGHTSRTYLVQTEVGELFQLPLAWYTQSGRWGMGPGFDRKHHRGLSRMVQRECMFCHNAYPDVPVASDRADASHVFPTVLPKGVGCQRCHGPGAAHAAVAMGGDFASDDLSTTIINPATLSAERRDDVCFACHLQPSISLPRVRRFGRGTYGFEPGDDLAGYMQILDVHDVAGAKADHFEINHHPYRLMQSTCWQASEPALSCLTCHDPHRKVPVAERAAHYRAACLQCHQTDSCGREHDADTGGARADHVDASDCVACHMPRRRTEDVVHVVVTDHRIGRPVEADLLASRDEREAPALAVDFLLPARAPAGTEGDLFLALGAVRAAPNEAAVRVLKQLLERVRPASIDPYLELVRGQLTLRRFADAERSAVALLERFPGHPMVREWLGVARAGQGQAVGGVFELNQVQKERGATPDTSYNLGRLQLVLGHPKIAVRHLKEATEARPFHADGWYHLALAEIAAINERAAVPALRRALVVEPSHGRAYVRLGAVLAGLGERDEAVRVLRHGMRWARDPAPVQSALDALLATAPGGR